MPLSRPLVAVSLVSLFALSACSDSTEPLPPTVASIAVTGVPDTAGVGDTLQASASARDSSGATLDAVVVHWRALDPAIASVDSTGRVVVRDVGVARLIASARARTTFEDTVVVHALLLPSRVHIAGLPSTLAFLEY